MMRPYVAFELGAPSSAHRCAERLRMTLMGCMDEPALSFAGVTLSPQKEIVRVFYKDMWDHADKSLIPKIFHQGFSFRGSLGPTLTGYDEFAGYVDWVTGAFGNTPPTSWR